MALPRIETKLSATEAVERVSEMSRRGKLPGFEKGGEGLFSALAYGSSVLDQRMICEKIDSGLSFRNELPPKIPIVMVVVSVLMVWPGVWLTNEMLVTYWNWYLGLWEKWWWITYAWYLPMMLPLPWMFRSLVRKSHEAAEASARELIGTIAPVVEGEVVETT